MHRKVVVVRTEKTVLQVVRPQVSPRLHCHDVGPHALPTDEQRNVVLSIDAAARTARQHTATEGCNKTSCRQSLSLSLSARSSMHRLLASVHQRKIAALRNASFSLCVRQRARCWSLARACRAHAAQHARESRLH